MTTFPMNRSVALVSCCLLALAGCGTAEKERALADLQAAQTALAEATRELADTEATLDTTQKERDGLKQDVQNLRDQNETQRSRIDQLTTDFKASALQIEQLKRQLSSLNEKAAVQNDALRAQVAALEEDSARKTALIKSMQERLMELQKIIETDVKPPETSLP